jgi:hypothetical protein
LYKGLVAAVKEKPRADGAISPEELLNILTSPHWYDKNVKFENKNIREFVRINKGLLIYGRLLEEWLYSKGGHIPETTLASEISAFNSRIVLVHTDRRLMITSQGRLGIAPKAAEQGILFLCSLNAVCL